LAGRAEMGFILLIPETLLYQIINALTASLYLAMTLGCLSFDPADTACSAFLGH